MVEPIRILMVNYKMQCAGIESFIMNMYRNVDRDRIQFDFLVHYKEKQFYDEEIEAMGGKIYRLSIREDNNFIKYFSDLNHFFENHPEYKIVHGHMESFGGFYLKSAKQYGVPVRIAHSHIAQRNRGGKGILKAYLNKSFGKYATDLFACSEISGRFIFGNNQKFTVYKNAIDSALFKFDSNIRQIVRRELGLTEEQFVVGHVGRFNTQKNHTFLIDIMNIIHQKNRNAVLLLIGEGDLEKNIHEKVEKLGLNNCVRFLGARRDVCKLYQAMDVFILPSLFEGLPVSGIEAQAAGLKCIFSDTVTKEASLTSDTVFLPLQMPVKNWGLEVLKWERGYLRTDTSKEIVSSGYDIKIQAMKLQEFYLEKYAEMSK